LKRSFRKLVQIFDEQGTTKTRRIYLNPPLVLPAIVFTLGILSGSFVFSYFHSVFFIIFLSLSLSCFYFIKLKKNKILFAVLLLVFILGFVSIIPYLPQFFKLESPAEYYDNKNLQIIGMVASRPEKKNIRTKFVLDIHRIISEQKNLDRAVSGKTLVYSYRGTPDLQYGDLISFTGSFLKPRNFGNPGGFDYVRYLSFKEIVGTSFANGRKVKFYNSDRPKSLSVQMIRKLYNFRGEFADLIRESTKDYKAFSILSALTTGIKEYIPEKLKEDFSKSGTSHVLAISGLHMSIIAGIAFFLFNFIFSRFKFLLIRGLSGKLAAMATLFPLSCYALVSGLSPSTQRAFIMLTIYILSYIVEREKDVLNSLAAAALIILVIDPCALFAVSFQLSFSAVLFIILGVYLTRDIAFFKKKNLFGRLSMFILVSFCAGLGTMPLVMHYFNIFSFVQLAANIVIIPIVGFIAVPLGLAAFSVFPFSKLIAGFLIKSALPFLSFSISFTEYIASLPFTWTRCVTPHGVEIFCFYTFVLTLFYLAINKQKKGVYILIFPVILFCCYSGFILKQKYYSGKLQVTVLGVGQGNSALVEGPRGAKILIDGGGFSSISTFDTGKYIIAPFLWHKKITTLDAVILTHPERDHIKGLLYIVENFKVKKFIKNKDFRETKSYINLMKKCLEKNVPIVEVPFEKSFENNIGRLNIFFLHPVVNKKGVDNLEKIDYNNNSLVFKVNYKNFSILFPGDIMEKTEKKLVREAGDNLHAQVLIAPHHGSSTSSTAMFLDKVKPENIVISCGWHNRYNFPNNKVIERYNAKNIHFFRTDHHGAVSIVSDGQTYKISPFKGD